MFQGKVCSDQGTALFLGFYHKNSIGKSADSCRKRPVHRRRARGKLADDPAAFFQDPLIKPSVGIGITHVHSASQHCKSRRVRIQCTFMPLCINPSCHSTDDLHTVACHGPCIFKCLTSAIRTAHAGTYHCCSRLLRIWQVSDVVQLFWHSGKFSQTIWKIGILYS